MFYDKVDDRGRRYRELGKGCILFLHVSVHKDVPQFLITNSHFESPL